MLNRWFLTDSIPLELCIGFVHDEWLVLLSYLVAAFASYTAFHLIARVRSAPTRKIRRIWLITAGFSMGCGIFAMHFIAMLAVRIPVSVQYDVTLTALSLVFAIVASGIAFHLIGDDDHGPGRLLIGAVVLGSGIGLMHYTGMSALRMPAHVYYDPYLFGLSVVVAVALSGLALTILRRRATRDQASRLTARLVGGSVMGLAVVTMHYTGMSATYFYPESGGAASGAAFDGTIMAAAVGAAAFLISTLAIMGSLLDQRVELAETKRAQSENYLQAVIDNSADGILTLDEDRVVQTCNPAAGRIFDRQVEGIVGQRLDELMIDDTELAVAGEETILRREAWVRHGVDGRREIAYTVNAMRFGGRQIFICLVRDITERKQAQAALSASEERFRSLVANLPGVVYQRRLSPDGKVSYPYISRQMSDLTGLESEDVMADVTTLYRIVHPDDREEIRRSTRHSANDLSPWDQVFRVETKSGEQKWIRTVSRPRPMPNGDIYWDGIFLDITDSVRQTEEKSGLERRLRQAQKMESLGTLAGGTAHEFNNMLTPIMGLTQLAMRELPEDGRARKNLERVLEMSRRAAQLVDKILAFSHADEAERLPVDLRALVGEATALLQSTTPATITIQANLGDVPQVALVDETQIHQVLLNLASNARHAMEDKVGELTIELADVEIDETRELGSFSLKPGNYARLAVSDTGHGIDEKTIERIFDPFFTTKEVGKGTGLGLAMIHSIVHAHGGLIDVESEIGRGTTFTIYLPLHDEEKAALALAG